MNRTRRSSQQGMALLISLVVLVVVSILGATAMRSAAFQSKVSINAQASQMLFQAAESGLASVGEFSAQQVAGGVDVFNPNHMFAKAYNGQPQRICYDEDGGIAMGGTVTRTSIDKDTIELDFADCPAQGDSVTLVSSVVSRPPCGLDSGGPPEGFSLGTEGFSYRNIFVQSFASIEGLGFEKSHVQLWSLVAPDDGSTTCT